VKLYNELTNSDISFIGEIPTEKLYLLSQFDETHLKKAFAKRELANGKPKAIVIQKYGLSVRQVRSISEMVRN